MSLFLIKNDPEERFRNPKKYLIRRKKELKKLYPDLIKIILKDIFLTKEQFLTFYSILEILEIPRNISAKKIELILSQDINLMEEYVYLSKHKLMEIESYMVFLNGNTETRNFLRIIIAKVLAVIRLS